MQIILISEPMEETTNRDVELKERMLNRAQKEEEIFNDDEFAVTAEELR